MTILEDLGKAIDEASDKGDERLLRQLGSRCEKKLEVAVGEDRVYLLYYQANVLGSIISLQREEETDIWDWEQSDGIQNVLLLRQAIMEPAFATINPTVSCQIRTNLAYRLFVLGRPVAANEQWLKVNEIEPHFAKALGGRAKAVAHYAGVLYDEGHKQILLAHAESLIDSALSPLAVWESGDRDAVAPGLIDFRNDIIEYLTSVAYEHNDLNQWSLGKTEAERRYRQWCLRQRLFLNPLNDISTDSVAATDVLHLPSHVYEISEKPRFPAYFNLLKQEYVSARYRFYRATHEDDPEYLMHDVLMLDSGEHQVLGHYVEDLRSAFRAAYALFDKIGLFLNDYYRVGLDPGRVSFRQVWHKMLSGSLGSILNNQRNWILEGLYFLSKDLFDESLTAVAEPDANDLAELRNKIEHRFVSFQRSPNGKNTDTHLLISMDDFVSKTKRILKLARESLIYLSLAMHREEILRQEVKGENGSQTGVFKPQRVVSFRRRWTDH